MIKERSKHVGVLMDCRWKYNFNISCICC